MSEKNIVEKIENEIEYTDEELVTEVGEDVGKTKESHNALAISLEKPKNLKKHLEAKKLVEEAKDILEASDNEMQDCKLLLEDDLRDYDDAKRALNLRSVNTKLLLSELGHTQDSNKEMQEDTVVFEAKEEVNPIVLQDVNSGKITGFILSLLGGIMTLGGLIYWATEKLDITVYLDKIPSNETIQSIFGWFGTQVGRTDDAVSGGFLVAGVVLLVMVLIYVIRVSLKGDSNLRFATKQMKETQKYITYKSTCKVEMDRVDAHITDAIKVLKDYEVVLDEQNGKLARIRHFEGKLPSLTGYHDKSVIEMDNTQNLIESISRFIATPMSEEGKLSGKSTLFLHSAKEVMQNALNKFV